jgi:hypothetical protein
MISRWSHTPDQKVGSKQPKGDKNPTWIPPATQKKSAKAAGSQKKNKRGTK